MIFERDLPVQMEIEYYDPRTHTEFNPLFAGKYGGFTTSRTVETHRDIGFRFGTIAEAEEHAKIIKQKIMSLETMSEELYQRVLVKQS